MLLNTAYRLSNYTYIHTIRNNKRGDVFLFI